MRLLNKFNAVWIAFLILTLVFMVLISRLTVNMFFMDQWDLEAFLVKDHNPIDQFFYLHAPHRQGLAYVLWGWAQNILGVDPKIPAWIAFIFIILATYLAIKVLRRQTQATVGDMIIPIIFISPKLHETLFDSPNPSHGPFPMFLLFGITLCFLIRDKVKQAVILSILCFLLVFSAFGLVIAPVVVAYAAVFASRFFWLSRRADPTARGVLVDYFPALLMLVTTIVAVILFLWNYKFSPSADCFTGQLDVSQQLIFSFLILSRVFGFIEPGMTAMVTGGLFFGILVWIFFYSCRILLRTEQEESQNNAASCILFTSGFTLAFVLLTAYGRECLGLGRAFESQYLPYLLPGFWAVFLSLKSSFFPYHRIARDRKLLVPLFVVACLIFEWRAYNELTQFLWGRYTNMTALIQCSQGDMNKVPECQEKLDIWVYLDKETLAGLIHQTYNTP